MAEVITEEVSVARPSKQPERQKFTKITRGKRIPRILRGLVIVIILGVAIYFYHQYQKAKADPVAQAGKLIELPQGETPTIATVNDITKLKGQDFFQNAANGDKILIYVKAQVAILYRPNINKIIKEAPFIMDQNNPSSSQNSPATPTASKAGNK